MTDLWTFLALLGLLALALFGAIVAVAAANGVYNLLVRVHQLEKHVALLEAKHEAAARFVR